LVLILVLLVGAQKPPQDLRAGRACKNHVQPRPL